MFWNNKSCTRIIINNFSSKFYNFCLGFQFPLFYCGFKILLFLSGLHSINLDLDSKFHYFCLDFLIPSFHMWIKNFVTFVLISFHYFCHDFNRTLWLQSNSTVVSLREASQSNCTKSNYIDTSLTNGCLRSSLKYLSTIIFSRWLISIQIIVAMVSRGGNT